MADKVIEKKRLEKMNSSELFLLAVGIYGHDWGMSVGNSEKHFIISGELQDGLRVEDLWVLPDEINRFKDFVRKEDTDDLKEIWSKYVRQTHAYRSAEKILRYFEPIDRSVGNAASKICGGHGLNFEDLQNSNTYPMNLSVLGESVNLRALTIYLRLIDLLDLAEDRTPYLIWKFVAPRNPHSRMEWAKHRALSQVTFPPYQEGRSILVNGSTDDQEVYAALEDLREFCKEQFQGCNDILAQMNDPRHRLDLFNIDWRIETKGFNKRSIRFEFDRGQMFKILSEELFPNDPYVFLRELLQNSIDAIHMRREILLNQLGMETKDFGVIRVNVEHKPNGNAVITWSDNGIGMDEFIIKNYLAVVGKSYYISDDFRAKGLKMDPISRFGIGILSCFGVADRIEIDTFRDRDLQPQSSPLRVIIPDELRYFRIETPSKNMDTGTTVRVFVEKNKISKSDNGEPFKPLDVTSYLSAVAGFVDIPILVTESDRKTAIISPNMDSTAVLHRFGSDFKVQQLNLGYPWEDAIVPQDYYNSRDVLREERVDIRSDLSLEGFEGVLSYLIPTSDNIDILYGEKVGFRDQTHTTNIVIRPSEKWKYSQVPVRGLSRSAHSFKNYSVYKDGILLSSMWPPRGLWSKLGPTNIPRPRIVANITKARSSKVDLARTRLAEESENWAKPIFSAYIKYIINKFLDKLLSLDPIERAYQIGRISTFHNISPEELWEAFPQDHWPFIFLEGDGQIVGDEWKNISNNPINLFRTDDDTGDFLFFSDRSKEWFDEFFSKWRGNKILIQHRWHRFPHSTSGTAAQYLWQIPIQQNYCLGSIHFIDPPWEGNPPFFHKIFVPREKIILPSVDDLLEKAIADASKLTPIELEAVTNLFKGEAIFAEPIRFPAPYDRSFAFGNLMANLNHPAGKAIFQVKAALELSKRRKALFPDRIGKLEDAFHSFNLIRKGIYFKWERFAADLNRIFNLANEYHLIEMDEPDKLMPSMEEFVPGTLEINYKSEIRFYNTRYRETCDKIKTYGTSFNNDG